jgi:hypothetical protein
LPQAVVEDGSVGWEIWILGSFAGIQRRDDLLREPSERLISKISDKIHYGTRSDDGQSSGFMVFLLAFEGAPIRTLFQSAAFLCSG